MAKDKITEYDSTAANNTVVGDVNLAENSALPSDMNNAVREVMSHQKEAFGSGTPLYVDQTNDRLGVGTASPAATQHTLSGDALVSVQATTNSTTGYHEYRYNTSTAVGYIGNGSSLLSGANNSDFIVRSEADLVFNSNGNNERLRVLSGGGLTFNGDTAAANALSDYEEGLSDVTVAPNTSGSITLYGSTNQLAYTKIGRLVHVQCELQVEAVSSPVGTYITVSGLPFNIGAVSDLGERFGGAALFHPGGGSASVKPLFGYSGTSFEIYVDASTTTVNTSIGFTFSYLT